MIADLAQTQASRALAPEWHVSRWFNTKHNPGLETFRGKVVAMVAFQMLCPGCVSKSIPQAIEMRTIFSEDDLAVIGFHTVFEHHAAMTPTSLEAFLHEYRIGFPVAVDEAGEGGLGIPKTMEAYAMRGTPTLILIDRRGRRRFQSFGHVGDLQVGALLASLIGETEGATHTAIGNENATRAPAHCDDSGCLIGSSL